jgi:hypothetical protein
VSLLSGASTQAHCPGLLEAVEPLRQSLGAVRASAPEFETGPSAAAIDFACEMAAAANNVGGRSGLGDGRIRGDLMRRRPLPGSQRDDAAFHDKEKDVPMTTNGNEGQSALVTGASGGIGLELARVLAANRFSLVARELRAQHGTQVTIVPELKQMTAETHALAAAVQAAIANLQAALDAAKASIAAAAAAPPADSAPPDGSELPTDESAKAAALEASLAELPTSTN